MARISMPALIALWVVACLVTPIPAAFISETGAPISLFDLGDAQLTAGDKIFYDFEMFSFAQAGAIAPDANAVFIQAGRDSLTGDYGLRFLTGMLAGSGQFVNLNLQYRVAVAEDFQHKIGAARFDLLSPATMGTGSIGGSEYLCDVDEQFLALLEVGRQSGDGGLYLKDREEFSPASEVWIASKDITVSGGTAGLAHLSEFHQYFEQVPEPVSMGLLAIGGALMLRKRRQA